MAEPTRSEEPLPAGAPTEVEKADIAVTVFEDGPRSSAATVRESLSSVPGGAGVGFAPLPAELGESYRPVRQLRAGGGEATLFDVTEISTGETRVLKLYHRHVMLRGEALLRIQSIDPAHVVQLVDHGQLEDGRWYEVLERVDAGNLIDYRSSAGPAEDDLEEVVAELAAAISAFHRAGLAHHDIKPENILVRSMSPLDLVLGDFGLSVVSDNSTYYATNRNATIAYQAPETMRQVGGGARDYWALGLTIAMLATGETPYAGLNEHAILDQHYSQVPPALVESMRDGRLKQLCRGLTRYDPKTRWSEREVRTWLRGGRPAVVHDELQPPPDPARVVHFNSKRFSVASELVREMLACWSLAAETIGVEARREHFLDELILAFGTESLATLTRRWSREPPRRDRVDAAVVELLLTLDPEVPAVYRSRPLDADAIAAAALGDSEEDDRFVRNLLERGVLSAWSSRAGSAELGDIDRRWREGLGRASEIVADVTAAGAAAPPVEDWASPLLAASARPELVDDWRQQREASRPTGELVPGWYEPIADGSDPADVIGSVLLLSEARRVQRNDLEARRRERQAARRARRDRAFGIARALVGWAAAVMFCISWTLDVFQNPFGDYQHQLVSDLLAYVIAFVLFRQWRNASHHQAAAEAPAGAGSAVANRVRSRIQNRRLSAAANRELFLARRSRLSRGAIRGVRALVRTDQDSLSAGRRAEAYGIAVLGLTIVWTIANSTGLPFIQLIGSDSADTAVIVRHAYLLTGMLSMSWSLLSRLHRRGEGGPTSDQVQQLRAADRRTLIKTGIWTAVFALARIAWLPLLVGGLYLLVRGRWSHRRTGTVWAIVLLAIGAALLLLRLLQT